MTVSQVRLGSRPPWAAAALAGIVVISAGWWALALWPLGSSAPEWIARTREVCFGATRDALPHVGGWILLFGEPIGMYAVLRIAFGAELRRDLTAFHRHALGRLASAAVLIVVAGGLVATLGRVANARARLGGEPFTTSAALPPRGNDFATSLRLLREDGAEVRLEDYRTQWVMVTFAFGHCDDICPVIVRHARDARRETGRTEVPLLVVTLDPWRDTPDRLAHIATQWELEPGDHVLGGTVADVIAVLDAWGIPRVRDLTTGDIAHGSTIALIDPGGRLAWRLDGAPQRIREALALTR